MNVDASGLQGSQVVMGPEVNLGQNLPLRSSHLSTRDGTSPRAEKFKVSQEKTTIVPFPQTCLF